MLLYLNAVYDLVLSCEFVMCIFVFVLVTAVITCFVWWNNRGHELKLTTIKFYIHKLVDQLTNSLSIARPQTFNFDILDIRQTELLEIPNHLIKSLVDLAFEVLEVDEHALLLVLAACQP